MAGGVRYRSFVVDGEQGEVPGALWTTPGGSGLPLVLIGHGASGSKQQDYVRALAHRLVLAHGVAAAAIDGPVHGDRRPDKGVDGALQFLDFVKVWSSDPCLTDSMVSDWRHTLDQLAALDDIAGPVGYWGLSMGTILGLPFVASEERVEAAVLGLMGIAGPTAERIAADAPRVTCAVLFLVQWSDELFPRETAFRLFDALGSPDKRLHANPGSHGSVPHDEFQASAAFLARRLSACRKSRPPAVGLDAGSWVSPDGADWRSGTRA
ncbi:MAG: alpha/beta hydrolase [Actinomycetota bacterium]|nr:alpha/beta hydrolase [Actinomycetota bacterium]